MLINVEKDRLIGSEENRLEAKRPQRNANNRCPYRDFLHAENLRIAIRFIAKLAVLANNTNYSYVNNDQRISNPACPSPPQASILRDDSINNSGVCAFEF